MATVMQSYKIVVHARRPGSRLVIADRPAGDRLYAVFDGDERLTADEVTPTVAWRQAEFNLANPHLAIL